MDGIIEHTYVKASDDVSAWDADQCNRQAVTVAFAYEFLCDEPLWRHSQVAAEYGMDPWSLIDSVDKPNDGRYEVWFTGTKSKVVEADFRLFAQRDTLRSHGFNAGEAGGWAKYLKRTMGK